MRAAQRREAELHELIAAGGIKAIHASRWHCQIGPMHLWLASGRWLNAETGQHGKINRMSLRELFGRYSSIPLP